MKHVDIRPVYDLLAAHTPKDMRLEFLQSTPEAKLADHEPGGRHEYVVFRSELCLGNASEIRFVFNEEGRIISVGWNASFGGSDDAEAAFYDLSNLIEKGFKRTYSERSFSPWGSMGEKRWRTFQPTKFDVIQIKTQQPKIKYPLRTLEAHRWFRQPEAAGPPPPPPTHVSLEDLFF